MPQPSVAHGILMGMNKQSEMYVAHCEIVKVLLVEDNPIDARLVQEMLAEVKDGGFGLALAEQLSTGLESLAAGGIDIVLLDLSLPDSQGLDAFAKAYAKAPLANLLVKSMGYDQTQQAEIDVEDAESTRLLRLNSTMIAQVKDQVKGRMEEMREIFA